MTRLELLDQITKDTITFNLQEAMTVLQYNMPIFLSWGISPSSLFNYQDKVLGFKVNGHHHKGMVYITLAVTDTYTVTIASTQNNIKKTIEGVYFDMLVDIIDKEIEYIEAYK